MIKVVMVNNVMRKEAIVEGSTTFDELLHTPENTTVLQGGNFAVNGVFISPEEWGKTLDELSGGNEIVSVFTVKRENNA